MVETRSSRRVAEEDSINSSQAQRARPRSQSAAEDSHPPSRTPKPGRRTKNHATEVTNSTRTPSTRRTRLNSAQSQPVTPSQAPRTRSRVRREAEESFASSESRLRQPEQPHPNEENSHVIRPISSTRPSTRRSQTRPESASDSNTKRTLMVNTPMRLTRSAARRTRAAAEAAVAAAPPFNEPEGLNSDSVPEYVSRQSQANSEWQSSTVPDTHREEHSFQKVDSSSGYDPNSVHGSPVAMMQLERSTNLENSAVEDQEATQTKKTKEAEVEVIVIDDNDDAPDEEEADLQHETSSSEAGEISGSDHETGENETANDGFVPVPQSNVNEAMPSDEVANELDDDVIESFGFNVEERDQSTRTMDIAQSQLEEYNLVRSDKREPEQMQGVSQAESPSSDENEQHQTSSPRQETDIVLSDGSDHEHNQDNGVAESQLLEENEPNQKVKKVARVASQQNETDASMSEEQEQMQGHESKSRGSDDEEQNQMEEKFLSSTEREGERGAFASDSPELKGINSRDRALLKQVKESSNVDIQDVLNTDKDNVAFTSTAAAKKPVDDSIRTVPQEPNAHITSVDQLIKLDDKMLPLFFRRDAIISRLCRELLKEEYACQTKLEFGTDSRYQFIPKRREGLPPMGPLAQVEIDDQFDSGQLWEELELRNKPLLAYLRKRIYALHKEQEDTTRALRRATVNDGNSESDEEPASGADSEQNGVVRERNEREDSEDPHSYDKDSRMAPAKKTGSKSINEAEDMKDQQKKVRFHASPGKADPIDKTDEEGLGENQDLRRSSSRKRSRQGLEDGFFNITDMESFAEEAEDLALSGKLIASDNEEDRSQGWSDGSSTEEDEQGTGDKIGRFLYSDFFDPPTKVGGNVTGATKALHLLEDDELSDLGARADPAEPEESRRSPSLDSETQAEAPNQDDPQATPLERSRLKAKKKIVEMEEASVSKKSWELRGEISAFARPKDSLLDTDMQHDISVKPKTFLTSEINETIEDLIKQRIVDGLFDDVVMQLPDAYAEHKRKGRQNELPDISQEKPTEGLADLYAREFDEAREKQNKAMLASKEVQREADKPLTEQQQEVNKLFEKISKKLDALSSLHFTPLSEDVKIDVSVKNVKAISAEEAIPEGVSDANLLAPKEVFSVDKKDAVGEKEVTKDERRAARRRKKSKKRKRQAADESKKQALVQTDPLLAEKKRAETALIRRGKKPKLAEKDPRLSGTQTKDLIKRFGGIKNPEAIDTQVSKKTASHFRL